MRLHFEHEKNLISTSFDKITTTNYFRNTINNGPVEELSFDYGDGTLFSDYYSSSPKSDSRDYYNKRNFESLSTSQGVNCDDRFTNFPSCSMKKKKSADTDEEDNKRKAKESLTAYKSRPFKSPSKQTLN